VSLAVAGVAGVTLVATLAVAATGHAAAPALAESSSPAEASLEPHRPSASPHASVSSAAPTPAKAGRYEPLYDRRY
jgi:hypothetical protein